MSDTLLCYPTKVVDQKETEINVKRIIIVGEFDNVWVAFLEEMVKDPGTGEMTIDWDLGTQATEWKVRPILMTTICPLANVITVGDSLVGKEHRQNAERLLNTIRSSYSPPDSEGRGRRNLGHRLWNRFRSYFCGAPKGHR